MKNISLILSEINEGAAQEKFEFEMKKVFENILDKNTEATKKRTVTLTFDVISDKDRELVVLNISSKSKLVPRDETSTKILFGRNSGSGFIEASELVSGARGQLFMDPDDLKIKTDVGEPVEEIEEQEKNEVIDFKKRRNN